MAARCSAVSPRSFLFRMRASRWLSVLVSFLAALLLIAGKSSLLLDPESCFASLAVTSRRYWSCWRSVRGKWGLPPSVGFEVEVVACGIFGPVCFLALKKKKWYHRLSNKNRNTTKLTSRYQYHCYTLEDTKCTLISSSIWHNLYTAVDLCIHKLQMYTMYTTFIDTKILSTLQEELSFWYKFSWFLFISTWGVLNEKKICKILYFFLFIYLRLTRIRLVYN